MNEKAREIIEVAKELTEIGKRASEVGIIGVSPSEFQMSEVEDFETIVESASWQPVEKERDCNTYPWEYTVEVDGIRFIYLSKERLRMETEEENESTR